MQSNIFAKLAPLLKEKKFNIDCDTAIEYLELYRSGQWIYPGAMHRSLKISINDVYEILELCAEGGLAERYLDIYCPFCQRFTGFIYKTIMDIPEELNCPYCDNEIQDPSKHAVIIYWVK